MTIYLAPALEQNVSWEISANTLNLPVQGLSFGDIDIAEDENGDTYITLNRSYRIQIGESSNYTSDAFIAVISEDGNIKWRRQLTNNSDDYERTQDLLQDSNDNLWVKFYSHEDNQIPQYIIVQISSNGEILNRRYGGGDYDIEFIPERENLLTVGGGNDTGDGYAIDENSNLSVFDQRGYEWQVQYGAQKTSNGNIVFNGYANDSSSDVDASNLKELPDVYGGNLKFTREVSPQGNLLWANELFTSGYAWSEFHSVQSSRASSKGDGLSGEDAANEENYLSVYTDSSGNKSISEQVINPVYLNKGYSGLTAIYPEDGTKATLFPGIKIIDKNDTNSNYLSRFGIVTNSDGYPQYFIDLKPLDSSPTGTSLELEGQSYYDTIRVKQGDGSFLPVLRKSTLATPIQVHESTNSFSANSSDLSAGKKLFKLFSETVGETTFTVSTAETIDLLSVDGDILKVNQYYSSDEDLDETYDFTVIAFEDGREAYRKDFLIQFEDIETPTPTPVPIEEDGVDQVASIDNITTQDKVSTFQLTEPISVGNQVIETVIIGTNKKDKITGTSYSEVLAGQEGKDVLKGGGGPDGFFFNMPNGFSKKQADLIKNFNSNEGDSLLVDNDVFDLSKKIKLKVVTDKKASKKAAKSKKDFVYNDKKGLLFFNENGKDKGWGDGGLFAKFQGAPALDASDFTIV